MHLALADLYEAKWTNEIHDEWIRNVLANRSDLKRQQLERVRNLMNAHVLNCLVDGYDHLIPSLKLPDEHDRHVLAAAICAQASIIITYNLRDFPAKALDKYKVTAIHPDDFLVKLIDHYPDTMCAAIRRLRIGLKKPPTNIKQYLAILEKQSLPKTVSKLEALSDLL